MKYFKFKRNEMGITLVEALVALGILSAAGAIMTVALGSNFQMLLMADRRTTAESLAKTQMEAINNAPYDAIAPYTYDKITGIPAGYDIVIGVQLIDPQTGAVSGTDLGVQKVTCNITCQGYSASTNNVIGVEAYKR